MCNCQTQFAINIEKASYNGSQLKNLIITIDRGKTERERRERSERVRRKGDKAFGKFMVVLNIVNKYTHCAI